MEKKSVHNNQNSQDELVKNKQVQNRQNQKIRIIKAKYYSKIRSVFDKSLGHDGDVYNKIEDIEKIIKECEKELSQFKKEEHQKVHVQTFENFLNKE